MNVLELMLSIGAITFSCAFPQIKDSCTIPPRLELAELLGDSKQESFPMGHVVRYTCRPGYTRYGAIRMICSEGTWLQVSEWECKKKRCGNPGDIDFGTFALKKEEDFVFGAIVEYSCDPGYQMISKYNSVECTATGWSRGLPYCEAKLCPPVVDDSVRVLSTIYDGEYTAGHVIKLECKNPNNKLNGPSQIHCTSNGTWNVDPPTCKVKLCPPVVDDSVRVLSTMYDGKYTAGHVIKLECKNPNNKLNGPSQIHCTSNGTWNVDPPTCKEHKVKKKQCFPPPEVRFGELIGEKKQMYNSGSFLQFKCVSYYKLQGKKEIKCRNGVWDQSPTCLVPCILNSNYIKGNNTYLVNAEEKYVRHSQTVKFMCFRTFGTSDDKLLNVKCLNGTLKYPKCVKMEPCVLNDNYLEGNNTIVVNASKKYLEHGETVKFKCLPTFKIFDSKQLNGKCLDGKLKYPKCVKTGPCFLNEIAMLENNITVKSGNKHCGNQKMQNKCGIKENETIEFTCLPGYETSEHEKLKGKCLGGVIAYPKCFKITADEIAVQPTVESEYNIY